MADSNEISDSNNSNSNDGNSHFFEGTEKLLEVWFASDDKSADLRKIERERWESLLRHVHCKVLSVAQDDDMVAFLLSESSMFVSKNRFILKTCGQTTLLAAIKPLLELARTCCGYNKVVDVFYSRKNFLRPDLQHSLHQSFEREISLLDDIFDGGTAYALGRINGDCWYLYTIDGLGVLQPDQTLELLMEDLDQEKVDLFRLETTGEARLSTQRSGIADIFPDAILDDYLFDPCGYSINGILPKGHYFTIHITPEPKFSYVSFETNVPKSSYGALINEVLKIFKPGKFLMTLFTNEGSVSSDGHRELLDSQAELVEGYYSADHQECHLKDYLLTYIRYCADTEPESGDVVGPVSGASAGAKTGTGTKKGRRRFSLGEMPKLPGSPVPPTRVLRHDKV